MTHRHLPGVVVVTVAGQVDRTTSAALADYLRHTRHAGEHVVADLADLTFLDSSGLQALLACAQVCAAEGARLHLAAVRGGPARVLEITGVDAYLPVHATVAAAVEAALEPGVRAVAHLPAGEAGRSPCPLRSGQLARLVSWP
ncbi:STAS domain-containing protein [[Actinomadura] parvosata]|uniref:STAS domain-containing protein n=1 Tax=[Actinomadura] parvosata TaxID=1955412 RepID=UPI00406C1492